MKQLPNPIRRSLLACGFFCLLLFVGFQANGVFAQDRPVKSETGSAGTQSKSPSMFFDVTGKVVTASEQPISGAKIMVRRMYEGFDIERQLYRGYQFARPKHDRPVGHSNREGEFRLQFSSSPAVYTVFAHRSGYAPSGTWASPNDPIRIRLQPGVSVKGSVVDQDNRPLKSAKVRLMAWFTYEANLASLAEMRKEVRMEGHLENDVIRLETQTAGNGTFRLDDLPKDRWVVLVVSADKFLTQCIVFDTGNDPTLEAGVSIPRFFDNGVIRLQPATRVELVAKAKDSGQPINLQAAYTSALQGMFSGRLDTEQVLKLEVRGNQAALPSLPTDLHRFWLVPDPSLGYMGAVLDIAKDDSTALIKKEIELVRGARVVGRVVDAVTEKPIPGVPIHYDPESLEEFAEIGADIAPTTSDKNGDFVMIVPPINGWLRQIGHVDGYRSISYDLNYDIKNAAPTHRISPTLDTDTRVEFRLKPATRVKLQVMDTEGHPVAYARFVTKRRSSASGWTTESGTADKQGQIKLPNIFAAIFAERPNNDQSANLPIEETILICSPDGHATATVQVPYPIEGQPDIALDIVLQPASSIRGRIVDSVTGEGVQGVWIDSGYDAGSKHSELGIYSTQSDAHGDFTLRPILSDASFRLHVSGPYIGYRSGRQQAITIPHSTNYDHGEISVIVYRDLERLLEVPEVDGLPPQQAFESLQAALGRVRARIAEVYGQLGGMNRGDSLAQAEMTVSERFGEAYLKLSRRTQDSDQAFAVLCYLVENSDTQGWGRSFYADRAKKALLERFLHREQEMLDLLPRILASSDTNHWQFVFDRTKDEELKAYACYNLIVANLDSLTWMIGSSAISEKEFTEKLESVKPLLRYAYREAANQEVYSMSIPERIESHLKMHLQNQELARPNHDVRKLKTFRSKLAEWLADYAGNQQ